MILTTDNIEVWDKLDWWGWSDGAELVTDDDDRIDILDKLDWWDWSDSEDLVTDGDDTIDILDILVKLLDDDRMQETPATSTLSCRFLPSFKEYDFIAHSVSLSSVP